MIRELRIMKKLILKHTLINAVQHDGKASPKAVLGKILAEKPELKEKVRELVKEVESIVKKVNSLTLEEQKKKLDELSIKIEKKGKEKEELPPLPNAVKGKVVTAFPPEPSKFPHIGHAKSAIINYLYARKYGGKFILRFEDSNPLKVRGEYYEAFKDGLRWLGIEWDEEDYLSDHIDKYYEVTEKLLTEGKAYVCTCPVDRVRRLRRIMKECEHRNQNVEKNLKLWDKMIEGEVKEGEANVRLKIDMHHKNAVMRDPAIMRPLHGEHPRVGTKYKVWPLYDFGTALLDAWEGVTHRVRSKEFEMRTELQNFIREVCGFKKHPVIMEMARFCIEGSITSGRKIRALLNEGKLLGWDDPRLVTLVALRKRGFLPEAIREFLLKTGVSKTESTITWDLLESINRHHVDPKANRYFGVLKPVKLSVKNAPDIKETFAPLHPDFPKRGRRRIPVDINSIYIEKRDFKEYSGKIVRLKDLFNVKLNKICEYAGNKLVKSMPKLHWVSVPNVKVKIVMPDAKAEEIIAEPSIKNVKVDDIIQFERIGFCRVDKVSPLTVYFTHK